MKNVLCTYHYDPLDRLNGTSPALQSGSLRFYCQSRIATEIQGGTQYSIMQHGDQLLAQQSRQADKHTSTLLVTDSQRSVLHTVNDEEQRSIAYSPFGHTMATHTHPLLNFNGERCEPTTGHYLLGNGYRAFNPVLMRFNSPDTLSPFDKGGINSYSYCQNNPISRRDTSGHFWISNMLSTLLGAEGISTSLGGMALAFSSTARTSGPAIVAYATGSVGLLHGAIAVANRGSVLGSVMATTSASLGSLSMTMGYRARGMAARSMSLTSLGNAEMQLDSVARLVPNRVAGDMPPSYELPPAFKGLSPENHNGPPPPYTPLTQTDETTAPQRVIAKMGYLPEVQNIGTTQQARLIRNDSPV